MSLADSLPYRRVSLPRSKLIIRKEFFKIQQRSCTTIEEQQLKLGLATCTFLRVTSIKEDVVRASSFYFKLPNIAHGYFYCHKLFFWGLHAHDIGRLWLMTYR
ncbi:unnamed protein product [Cuscuta epithymum]|uniref:Uncharacterized protein n=1 Tax=Cuscuta epithymum TaxID=186058 RepID=A0AAV0DFE4_9ASTE|nr:unnamed protein product [Cuscuta epithymum]